MRDECERALARLTAVAIGLPETVESTTVHHPSFRVRSKVFAIFVDADPPAAWLKSTAETQTALVASASERFFVPPYLGPKGWVGIRLGPRADWTELAELVSDAYRLAAPKTLVAQLDSGAR